MSIRRNNLDTNNLVILDRLNELLPLNPYGNVCYIVGNVYPELKKKWKII